MTSLSAEITALREEMRQVREALDAASQREIAVEAIYRAGHDAAVRDRGPQPGRRSRARRPRPGPRPDLRAIRSAP
jgi:hypothetical protein